MRRVLVGPFSIRRVPMGLAITHPWRLQFVIKVSAWSFLHPTYTYGTLQHLTYGIRWLTCHVYLWNRSPSPSDLWDPTTHLHSTCGTRRLAYHLTLSIRHKNLCSVLLHPTCGTRRLTCHVYLWDLSPSLFDLWDPTVCVSLVPCVPSGFNFSKKVWYLGVKHGIWTKDWSVFTIVLDTWLC
jgi:hypothetical protein